VFFNEKMSKFAQGILYCLTYSF
jgi:hypothetical protein